MGIWGKDERQDYYEIEDENVRRNANCTVAIVMAEDLVDRGDGVSGLYVQNFGSTYDLCTYERFHNQSVTAGPMCTGFLVQEDVVATAAHFANDGNVRDLRIILDYHLMTEDMMSEDLRVRNIFEKNIYKGVKTLHYTFTRGSDFEDWTLVKLDRKVHDGRIAILSDHDVECDQPVYMLGHPVGLPLKYAPGAKVRDVRGTYFVADLDTYSGNSGAPIFNEETHEVVGMVVHGDAMDFRWTGKCWISVVYDQPDEDNEGSHCIKVSKIKDFIDKFYSTELEFSLSHYENELRDAVSKDQYDNGKTSLQKILNLFSKSEKRLREEFGYIYDFDNPSADKHNWEQKQDQISWRRKVWQVMSVRNNFELKYLNSIEKKDNKARETKKKNDLKSEKKEFKDTSKQSGTERGTQLEKAVYKLFREFFSVDVYRDNYRIMESRQQGGGLQYGHDLQFTYGISENKKQKILIECKNYARRNITLKDVADKLIQAKEYHRSVPFDHWILVNPNKDITNELHTHEKIWDTKDEYPFDVQFWTPDKGIKELFGLIPEIYDELITNPDHEIPPKDWNKAKRKQVIEFWKKKLYPPVRLPYGWKQYLDDNNPVKQSLPSDEQNIENWYAANEFVHMDCKDATGTVLPHSLEETIYQWLEIPVSQSPSIFLLGDFGDGKTFFTYFLTRQLVKKFKESPTDGWIPVRFALKRFISQSINDPVELLKTRLKEMDTTIAGWNELKKTGYKILVILDGFDEMSKEVDPQTIRKNIEILRECIDDDYFKGTKILVTSRKHFLNNNKQKELLLDILDNPTMLHLAPITPKTVRHHLRVYAKKIGEEEKFNELAACPNSIDIAAKPLFLSMFRESLKELPVEDLNEYKLYETYIRNSLIRKKEFLSAENNDTLKTEITENLQNVLERVAMELHKSNRDFVYLSEIRGNEESKKWLWDLTVRGKKTIEDEIARVAERSLLKHAGEMDGSHDKNWPVSFCHRSFREYFLARSVIKMVETNSDDAEEFLDADQLTPEIIHYCSEMMKQKEFDFTSALLHLIGRTRSKRKEGIEEGYLGGNSVTLLYQYKKTLPGNDWHGLNLNHAVLRDADLSGKNFFNTLLRGANLDNVNFTDSDFRDCDFTGVRIEETADIQSLDVYPDGNIVALYKDGIIRQWKNKQNGESKNLLVHKSEQESKIFAQPGNDLVIQYGRYLIFYDKDNGQLKRKATIEINPNKELVRVTENFLLIKEKLNIALKEDFEAYNQLLLIDLHKQAIVNLFTGFPFSLCDHLDDLAFVILTPYGEIHIIDGTHQGRSDLVIPAERKIKCLSACKKSLESPNEYFLGLGFDNGSIQVWQIDMQQWRSEKRLDKLIHKSRDPIKDISFVSDYGIVTGGLDNTIFSLELKDEGTVIGTPKEFKMALKCRDMKTEGIIRKEFERIELLKIIQKSKLKDAKV